VWSGVVGHLLRVTVLSTFLYQTLSSIKRRYAIAYSKKKGSPSQMKMLCHVRYHVWHTDRETYHVREARTGSSVRIKQTAKFREPCVKIYIAQGFLLETVAKFTHNFQPDAVCFTFATLILCQPFPFSCSIADALATLIVCVFPRLTPHIPITALAFHVRADDGDASLASRLKSGATMVTLIMKLIWYCRLIMHYKILRSIMRRDQHPGHSPSILLSIIFPSFYCIEIQRPIECLWRSYLGPGCTISSSKACASG
jgi:hypothetical protein